MNDAMVHEDWKVGSTHLPARFGGHVESELVVVIGGGGPLEREVW